MYCRNCGKELNDNAKFCSNCGTSLLIEEKDEKKDTCNRMNETIHENKEKPKQSIEESINDQDVENNNIHIGSEYLIYEKFKDPSREKILTIGNFIIEKVIGVILVIMIFAFIAEQYDLNEGYPFMVYFIRFLIEFSFPIMWINNVGMIIELFSYRKNQLKKKGNKETVITLFIVMIILWMVACYPFISPSDGMMFRWFGVVTLGNISDFISSVLVNVLSLIGYITIGIYMKNNIIELNDMDSFQ